VVKPFVLAEGAAFGDPLAGGAMSPILSSRRHADNEATGIFSRSTGRAGW
jgi:hypothetical protein